MVQSMRFELTRAYAHYPLKVACLPFHHDCDYSFVLYNDTVFSQNNLSFFLFFSLFQSIVSHHKVYVHTMYNLCYNKPGTNIVEMMKKLRIY